MRERRARRVERGERHGAREAAAHDQVRAAPRVLLHTRHNSFRNVRHTASGPRPGHRTVRSLFVCVFEVIIYDYNMIYSFMYLYMI